MSNGCKLSITPATAIIRGLKGLPYWPKASVAMPWAIDTTVGRNHVPLVRVLAPLGEYVLIVHGPLVAIEVSKPIRRRV